MKRYIYIITIILLGLVQIITINIIINHSQRITDLELGDTYIDFEDDVGDFSDSYTSLSLSVYGALYGYVNGEEAFNAPFDSDGKSITELPYHNIIIMYQDISSCFYLNPKLYIDGELIFDEEGWHCIVLQTDEESFAGTEFYDEIILDYKKIKQRDVKDNE